MEDATHVSVLQTAAEADMLVKLHLNGQETIIPVKNLLKINPNKEEISDTASYHILRHCALTSLFKFRPNQEIPDFAWNSFVTHIYYMNDNNIQQRISGDQDLTNVLKKVCAESMMDDKDGVVLKVRCKIVHNYRCQEIENIRKAASDAADNAIKTMKAWLDGTKKFFALKKTEFKSRRKGEDYVMVHNHDDDETGSNHTNVHWASRFVQFLLAPETMYHLQDDAATCRRSNRRVGQRHPRSEWEGNTELDDLVQNAVETAACVIVEGFTRAADLFNEACEHQKMNSRKQLDFAAIPHLSRSPSLASNGSSISSASSGSKVGQCEEDGVVNQDVEIVFDEKDKNAAEWKIFFGDEEKSEEHVFVIDDTEEVISMDSLSKDDSSGKKSSGDLSMISSSSISSDSDISFEQISNSDEDDNGSWAMLDEE